MVGRSVGRAIRFSDRLLADLTSRFVDRKPIDPSDFWPICRTNRWARIGQTVAPSIPRPICPTICQPIFANICLLDAVDQEVFEWIGPGFGKKKGNR